MLDRKCQNTALKEKVGQKSAWDLCLNTFTPPTQSLQTSSRIPRHYKGSALHRHVFRFRVTSVVNRCRSTTAAAAVTRLLWSCPGEPDARAGLGSSRIMFCISAKFVTAGMRCDNEKTEGKKNRREEVFLCLRYSGKCAWHLISFLKVWASLANPFSSPRGQTTTFCHGPFVSYTNGQGTFWRLDVTQWASTC